jgi:hypothetical protein
MVFYFILSLRVTIGSVAADDDVVVYVLPLLFIKRMHLAFVFAFGSEMKHLNKNKSKNKNTTIVTAAVMAFLTLAAPLMLLLPVSQSAEATPLDPIAISRSALAPAVVSGDNIYIAWWTNNTENGNEEVMFRASNDGGATFTDKINLSNTTDADSWRVEIAGEGDNVIVSWWETNQTSDTPVARISNDAGQTFGPLLRLATNGTIGSTEEGGGAEGEETVEGEEAVGGAEVAE